MKRTSRSILRRCNRLDRLDYLTDTEGRGLFAKLLAEYLTYDAGRNNLEGFRADASGGLHIYSIHYPNGGEPGLDIVGAIKRGSISKRQFPDCFTTRYLTELVGDCGPDLRELDEIATRLRRDLNSEIRRELRKRDKTKRGMEEAAHIEAATLRKKTFIRDVAVANNRLYELVKGVPKAELSRLGIDPSDFQRVQVHMPLRSYFPQKLKLPKRIGSKPPNATTWRKGGPNPRKRTIPDS